MDQDTNNSTLENTQTSAEAKAVSTEQKAVVQPAITLDQMINLSIEKEASDIHLGEGERLALRVEGKIVFIENVETLSKAETEAMIFEMLPNEDERKRLERVREIDFSYIHSSGVNFRVNVFYQRGKLSAVMRMISRHLPTMDELGFPQDIKKLLSRREGLILVCGTAGSGKSTSIQAMLEYVNENFVDHIITIENPIEYIFEEKKSIFTQRELGKDSLTMANALHSVIRQDPNIIMVSEINDAETLDQVLSVVEMGHLVIATMLTKDVKQTLDRMITMFPQVQQDQTRDRVSDNLVAVLAQDLVDRVDQTGRVAVYELLINDPGIRNIIKRGNFAQLRTAIQSGAGKGMITMDTYAYQLAEQGIISQESVNQFTENE